MGGGVPDPHDVEWLDDGRPPGRVRRLLDGRLSSRWVKASIGVLAAAVVTAVVVSLPNDTEAQPRDEAPRLSEPLAESIDDVARDDEAGHQSVRGGGLAGPVRVERRADGYATRLLLVNRTSEQQRPSAIRVRGTFLDASSVDYRAKCVPSGASRNEPVEPGGRAWVTCRDVTRYERTPLSPAARRATLPPLDRHSFEVVPQKPPCESEGRPGSF